MRILHVTEAMAAGTLQVIAQLANCQVAEGHTVHIVHSTRRDTPSPEKLSAMLPAAAIRTEFPFVTNISPLRDLLSIWRIRRLILDIKPDIVHAHSSKAGAIVRLACALPRSPPVCYSPHGFSFLREDVSSFSRALFRLIERALARLPGTIMACSESEGRLASSVLRAPRVAVVENSIDTTDLPEHKGGGDKPVIISSGRLCFQKAPWRFFELAEQLADTGAQFVWVGAGDVISPDGERRTVPPNVEVTGWLDHAKVLEKLAGADIYVLLSMWEGMPLVLIEAQAIGLPAVTTDVTGSRDVVIDGKTGFVCIDSEQWTGRVRQLLATPELRKQLGKQARDCALERFTLARQHERTMAVYRACCSRVT